MTTRSPLTELTGYAKGKRIFVKHEFTGTTGSMKDRMVARALECAIADRKLKPGMEIVEASSGNTGAALAYAGTKMGFAVHIFVAETVSQEKTDMIKRFGGIVHVGTQGNEIELSARYAAERGGYLFNQFENPYHVPAYKDSMGSEVVAQLQDMDLKIDHFVCGVGSGGSIRAVGEMLRQNNNPGLEIWGVVPSVFPSDIEGLNPGHLRKEGHFQIWLDRDSHFESGMIEVADEDAFAEIITLVETSGLSVGPASGACLYAARTMQQVGNVLLLLTDIGTKYTKKIEFWKQRLS